MGFAIGECTPPAYFWDKGIVNGYCMDTKIIVILMFLYSTSSLLSDATFAVFPMFLMRGLQMDKRTKYALIPILGLGWIASIAVLIRFAFLTSLGSQDITYDALTIAILSSIEQGLAITAGNLATLRPLFKRRFWLWGSYVAENSGDNGHHPPTIGAQDRAKGRIGTDASVGLDTFTFEGLHDEETGIPTSEHNGSVLKSQGIAVTTDIAVINQRRNNLWRSSRREDNESQEELNSKPSNEALDSSTQIVPASFLTNEGRLRDSAEAYNS